MTQNTYVENPDVILVGSGIMSATLGVMLKCLEPRLSIQLYEATDELAQESSNGWNNAGTGHAGICELSYTPTRETDGSVSVWNAITMFEKFERSKQFWAYAVERGLIDSPRDFINPIPHISFVQGADQVAFLKARHEVMVGHPFFNEMVFSCDPAVIGGWAPLLVEGRPSLLIGATRMEGGTDVNFGVLARKLLSWLSRQEGCGVAASHRVTDLKKAAIGWDARVRDLKSSEVHTNRARFIFVGAGGGSLHLLQKSGIPESRGLGGFPIGGQWLVCENPEIVGRHEAKVYGQALGAAPTMAVPHLDTRFLDGRKVLLFGPFAAWTTKFLHKEGRWTDLFSCVKPGNISTLVKIGVKNVQLIRYLLQQGTQGKEERIRVLREFYPAAQADDWKLLDAGIRVQAIKKTDGEAGIIHYGTEIITSSDGTLSALLGASPGASVATSIAMDVVDRCRPHLLSTREGKSRMKEMVPAYGEYFILPENAGRFREVQTRVDAILKLA